MRLGLILEDLFVSKYVVDFVTRCLRDEALQVSYVYITPNRSGVDRSTCARSASLASRFVFAAIRRLEKGLIWKNPRHHDHLHRFDLPTLIPNIPIIDLGTKGAPVPKNAEIDDDSAPDLLVSFCPVEQRLFSVVRIAKHGLLQLSHSDEYAGAGGLVAFWEVYDRRDVTGFTISHFYHDGKRAILLSGRVGTEFYSLLNEASLFEKSFYYLFHMVACLATERELPPQPAYPAFRMPRGLPTPFESLLYIGGLAHLMLGRAVAKIRGYKHFWNVAVLHDCWRNADLWRFSSIRNPSGRFLADPFVVSRNGTTVCFVEEFDRRTNFGKIAAYRIDSKGGDRLGVALEETFHLSFPYVFEYKQELYMCPETSGNRDIRIYRCIEFPLQWHLQTVIMSNVSAVDTILFERNRRWWMLTSIDPAGWDDYSMELHVFSADSPLAEKWTPHPGNPFSIDSSRGRNGGIILEDGEIFRIAQARGFDMYGKSIAIYRVAELTDDSYREEKVWSIEPTFKLGVVGTHHIHSNGATTVIDFAHDGRATRLKGLPDIQ